MLGGKSLIKISFVNFFWMNYVVLSLVGISDGMIQKYDRHQILRVNPKTEQQWNVLRLLHSENKLDFWRAPNHQSDSADIHLHPRYKKMVTAMLKRNSIQHDVALEDLQAALNQLRDLKQKKPFDPSAFDYARYLDYDNMQLWLQQKTANNSDIASMIEVGKTYEGRPIYAIKISAKVGRRKKVIWLDGGIHAREWIAPATMLYFIGKILDGYGENPDITYVLGKIDIYIIPVFNVDGYIYSWKHDRLWRKTRSLNKNSSCIGTDANRNWDYHWGEWRHIDGKANPCHPMYPGPHPFSEIEVRSVSDYLRNMNGSLQSYLSYHNYGQMIMFPYGYSNRSIQDYGELMGLCEQAKTALYQVHGTQYQCGSLNKLVGANAGSSVDYVYGIMKVKYTYGIELRDKGVFYFLQPETHIVPSAEESFVAFMRIASHVINQLSIN